MKRIVSITRLCLTALCDALSAQGYAADAAKALAAASAVLKD